MSVDSKGPGGCEETHEIRFPQAFSDTVQLIRCRPGDSEILWRSDTSDPTRAIRLSEWSLNGAETATHVSIVEMNGFGFGFSGVASGRPATTGSIKYGPNLRRT